MSGDVGGGRHAAFLKVYGRVYTRTTEVQAWRRAEKSVIGQVRVNKKGKKKKVASDIILRSKKGACGVGRAEGGRR